MTLLTACHKPSYVPTIYPYLPIEVGADRHEKHFLENRDGLGKDNISSRNTSYCELTAFYWAWKNLDYDALGLRYIERPVIFTEGGNMFSRLRKKIKRKLTEKSVNWKQRGVN